MHRMTSRMRLTIAVAALAMQALAPIGVYAAAPSATGPGDVCSVYSKARAVAPAGTPSPSRSHDAAHCTLCTGASSSAAIPPSWPAAFAVPTQFTVAAGDTRTVLDNAPSLSPPPRGPPLFDLPQ